MINIEAVKNKKKTGPIFVPLTLAINWQCFLNYFQELQSRKFIFSFSDATHIFSVTKDERRRQNLGK